MIEIVYDSQPVVKKLVQTHLNKKQQQDKLHSCQLENDPLLFTCVQIIRWNWGLHIAKNKLLEHKLMK